MNRRISSLRKTLSDKNLFAMLITSYENYRYFSGFSGSNCTLIITADDAYLLTDGRYTEQAQQEAPNFKVLSHRGDLPCEVLAPFGAVSVGYETSKITDLAIATHRKALPEINWVPVENFALSTRAIKDSTELSNIETAVKIADDALSALIPQIKVGMTEREIKARLEYNMALLGSEKCAFDTIVASGVRSSMPHASPTDKKVEAGDLITIDFGACFNGYMSDITRTLWLGTPSEKLREIYDAVAQVQELCVKKIAPGVKTSDIDTFQREEFEKLGLSEYLCHSLGHGVGLEIHEAPTLSKFSEETLLPGMVVTVEPGLYIPGVSGIRIEDTVLVTDYGYRVLTQSPHHIAIEV